MRKKTVKKKITKKKPEKRLLLRLKKRAGRARSGSITVRHKGGGVKRLYRIIDFGQNKIDIPAKVIALEYDPYRTSFIVLLRYSDGKKRYRIAPEGLKVGDEVINAPQAEAKIGNRVKLKNIPIGMDVYNIEIISGKGGIMVRSAGNRAEVLAQEGKYVHLKMPSGEIRKVFRECYASIGMVSNVEHRYKKLGKAGISRLKGRRPSVRGTAMAPVSHPHGGGEGKSPIGMPYPKTPWGKIARGGKTRKRKYTDKYIIKSRRKKKK